MASVMQGDAYNIPVTIKSGNGTLITPEIAACVEITVGQFTKRWPGQVTFDEKTGEWQFPVTQKQTFRFAPGAAVVQARVVFQDGSIMGGSGAPVRVEQSASHGTLPQPEKTEAVTGSAPKATEVTIPTVHDIDVSLHSQVILSDPIKAPYIGDNGNWYEYDAATGTFVDTGTSASGTPPITPDTAGKYLTNDGSKAEWGEVKKSVEVGDAKDGNLLKLSGSDVLNAATPNVDYALPILYVTITQDGQDSSGNPIYKSDKTYAEIKAAHDAGREVEIADKGIFAEGYLSQYGINKFPLVDLLGSESSFGAAAIFYSSGIPFPRSYESFIIGGQPTAVFQILIPESGNVLVKFPFDIEGWESNLVNKLPQQYIINVTEGTDGTLTADWSYEQIQKTINAYETAEGGTAVFSAKFDKELYAMCGDSWGLERFVFRNMSDLSKTMYLSKDNVWYSSNAPLDTPFFEVKKKDDGSYYITDENGKEINPQQIPVGKGIHPFIYYGGYNYLLYTFPEYATVSFISFKDQIGGFKYSVIDINRRYGTVTVQDWKPICPNQTPEVTTADNGKFLRVVDGQWAAEAVANAKGVSF